MTSFSFFVLYSTLHEQRLTCPVSYYLFRSRKDTFVRSLVLEKFATLSRIHSYRATSLTSDRSSEDLFLFFQVSSCPASALEFALLSRGRYQSPYTR